ncbi:MAG: RidA family protein [Deltaproteobacteria bacterium]|nr:MAG: RidA family protein [Deltaproteobacteria bacterium]
MKRAVSTGRAPAAIGPYSQAIVANGLVFCSGQIPLDPESGDLVGRTAGEQARRAMDNLGAVLEAAGASFDSVVRCTIFLQSMDAFAEVNEVYASYFGSTPPSRACVEVARLPRDVMVEVDAIAVVDER